MSTHILCLEQKYEKYQNFLSENFQFLEVKVSVYLNRCVFIMTATEEPMMASNQFHSQKTSPLTGLALRVKFSADNILKYFFLFFLENCLHRKNKKNITNLPCAEIILKYFSIGDNLHEMSNPVSWKNKKNITNTLPAELVKRVVKATWLVRFNPYPAVHNNPYLCKQCRSRSDGFWSGFTLFVIQFVNLNKNSIWCNLIGDSQKWVWLMKLFSRIRVNMCPLPWKNQYFFVCRNWEE